ncbi:hypothetical protein BDQ12DRAFT_730271 [Crucibulum laeve]|uniref:Uncharacterized protein n=1 Tax=Crucibulum laeve TaxID=68775 RepID=A0A5C3MG10_9AGAR|nr:hypothetical protein BDQ12DRAFT_730271 [Crucibulum laeve]
MATGPPPSAAESSKARISDSSPQPQNTQAFSSSRPAGLTQSYYRSAAVPDASQRTFSTGNQPYYNYSTWQSGWPAATAYSYASGPLNPQLVQQSQPSYGYPSTIPTRSYQGNSYSNSTLLPQQSIPVRTPLPPTTEDAQSPPLSSTESYRHWDEAIKTFLVKIGFTQTLRGFESDMLVLNSDFEQKQVPEALKSLVKNIESLSTQHTDGDIVMSDGSPEGSREPLDDRKLKYVHLANGQEPRSQTSINKSISSFLARNHDHNNRSNREEFLLSLEEKRRQLHEKGLTTQTSELSSCARTDSRSIDRDAQMTYDIKKNEDGPLSRTVKDAVQPKDASPNAIKPSSAKEKEKDAVPMDEDESATAARYPALEERLANIETHIAVRFVPSPPRTLVARLKLLEEHLIRLEKEYPPWAALHFNQPSRGWPPPPRATPIIVPSHQRSTDPDPSATAAVVTQAPEQTVAVPPVSGAKSKSQSSLQRAVMERLEVQQAMTDLAGGSFVPCTP